MIGAAQELITPPIHEIEAELVSQVGLREFMKLAWPKVEPKAMLWNWHIDAMCEHLEAVSRGEIRKLLICVPPGCMKTLAVSVFWPAWDWAEVDPGRKFIFSTYAQSLSDLSAKRHRDIVNSDWYQAIWGSRVSLGTSSVKQVRFFQTKAHGFRFSTSVGGEVTGRHGDVTVWDDLVKAQDASGEYAVDPVAIRKANEFKFETLATRMADPPNHRDVGIMQRLHHDDTAGRCIASGEYETLILPMELEKKTRCITSLGFKDPRTSEAELLWPERFSDLEVVKLKGALGPHASQAQLQQNPTPKEGALFKRETFQRWGEPDSPRHKVLPAQEYVLYLSVDCSFKKTSTSDYVAAQLWMQIGTDYLLLDEFHERAGFNETCTMIRGFQQNHAIYEVLVEDKANGSAVLDRLGEEFDNLVAIEPAGGKEARANAVLPVFHAGHVFVPGPGRAPWIEEFVTEFLQFPFGRFDDRVDATTQLLVYCRRGGAYFRDLEQ